MGLLGQTFPVTCTICAQWNGFCELTVVSGSLVSNLLPTLVFSWIKTGVNLKHNQLSGNCYSLNAAKQNTPNSLLHGSLAFSVLTYLTLTQTVAAISSQHIAPVQISPLQAAIQYNHKIDQALFQQTAEVSAQWGNTLLPEFPALTLRLEQPVKNSNPLFFTLENLSAVASTQQQQPEQQRIPNPPSQQTFVVINTKSARHYPYQQATHKQQDTVQAEVTAADDALTAGSVDTELSLVTPEAILADVHSYDYVTAMDVIDGALQLPVMTDAANRERHLQEPLPVSEPDRKGVSEPDNTLDGDTLISSKSFVSTIGNSSSSGYQFNYYSLAVDSPILASEYDKNGNPLTSEKNLALHGTPADGDMDDTNPAGVYQKNLPGLLAYDIIRPVVVVVDAGHGGVDPGTIGAQGLMEKDITLDMAKRLQTLAMLHSDIEIVLSRDDSDGLSRAERIASVTNADADLLISLHFNSLPEGDITLVETYYTDAATPDNYINTASRLQQSAAAVTANTPIRQPTTPFETTDISRRLARHLQSSVFGAVQNRNPLAIDAGVKQQKLFLLAQSGIPSVLIELTCLSNEQEENRLRTEQYRNELAHSLMNAMRKFVDSETLASPI